MQNLFRTAEKGRAFSLAGKWAKPISLRSDIRLAAYLPAVLELLFFRCPDPYNNLMKTRLNSSKSYFEIKKISDEMYAGTRDHFAPDMRKIIEKYGSKLRPAPHLLHAMTFSIPTTIKNSFVVGVRYKKPNGVYTEDHFLFQKNGNMKVYSKNELERVLPEYKGTHKGKPNFFEYTDREGLTSFSIPEGN
jgi:hypothetical protein